MTEHHDRSAANGEAAIERAAREATLANRVYRSDGDLWTDTPINLSKFVRFLALQPHVLPDDAQAWQLPKSLPLEGFASQPSPAATVETDALRDSRNPNHGRSGGLRDPAPERCSAGNEDLIEEISQIVYQEASISHFGSESEVDNSDYVAREILRALARAAITSTEPQTAVTTQDAEWLKREISSAIYRHVKPTTHPHFVDRLELSGVSDAADTIATLSLSRPEHS